MLTEGAPYKWTFLLTYFFQRPLTEEATLSSYITVQRHLL